MGFFKRAVRSLENPLVKLGDEAAWDEYLGTGKSASGVRINRKSVLKHSAVFRGVSLVATTVGKLAFNVRVRETKEIDRAHPAYPLLRHKANAETTAFTFRQTLTAHAILQGGGYAYIVRRGDGAPLELLQLLPDRTFPVRENGALLYVTTLGGTLDEGGEPRKLPADDVLHVKGLGWDGLQGYSLIALAADSLGLALAGERYAAKYFKNAASPSVLLELPGELSDKAYARIQASWQKFKSGLDEAHKTAILEGGAKASPFSIKPADTQLVENRKFDLVAVANWLQMPVHKLGGEGRTAYASLEQENQSFLDECLDGWLCNWEAECSDKLLTEEEQRTESRVCQFLRQQLVQANITQRYAAYRTAVGGHPFLTINEVRSREDMPPVEGGDELARPLNMSSGAGAGAGVQGPGAGEEKEKESDDEESQRRLRAAHRQVLVDVVRRMTRRLDTHAARIRNDPHGTLRQAMLQALDEEHGDVIREAFEPIAAILQSGGRSVDLAAWLLETYRKFAAAPPPHRLDADLAAAAAARFFPEPPAPTPETRP